MKYFCRPGWCGSVDCEPKGLWFDSWSGNMPGLWARFLAEGIYERQPVNVSLRHQCFSPSLSPSFPISLKINKIFKKKKKYFCNAGL